MWRGVDLNHRRRLPADLQSAPFGRLGTSPNKVKLSRRPDLNRRPTDYKSVALPAELRRQSFLSFCFKEQINKRHHSTVPQWHVVLIYKKIPEYSTWNTPKLQN